MQSVLKAIRKSNRGTILSTLTTESGNIIGIDNLSQGGIDKDFLVIHFRGEDKLYVPTDKIDLIQKYVASGEKEPKLHKMGSADWTKTKSKVSAAVQDIADDLIILYAKRESEKGHAFAPDDDLQRAFENAFPYDETDDQLRSIQEVKLDMEKRAPDGSVALRGCWLRENRSGHPCGVQGCVRW